MTVLEIAAQLLQHYSPEERSIPDAPDYPGRNAAVLQAINGALQELFGNGSPWLRYDERGAILYAPTAVPITVTTGSTLAVIADADWQDWFAGCTIVMPGAAIDNQLRNDTAAALRLKFPHDGATGTVTAMVYHDSVTLGDDVMQVVEPVTADGRPIPPTPSAGGPLAVRSTEDFGFHRRMVDPTFSPLRVADSMGRAFAYSIESWSPGPDKAPSTRMRLSPAAAQQSFLSYNVMLAPPVLVALTSQDTLPVPLQFIESILLPVARQRLSSTTFFRQSAGMEEIGRAYREAVTLLKSLNPRKNSGIRIRPVF